MKKSYGWLRFLIQGVFIVLIVVLLTLFYNFIRYAADKTSLNTYAFLTLAAVLVCVILVIVTQIFFTRKDQQVRRHERDEDLLKLKTKAQTDSLTGLLNREESIEQISRFLSGEGHHHTHTLLMVDLDSFKSINDNFGHFEGDKVLKIIAGKIKSAFRNIDIVGRFGGDEFIVLMKHTSTKSIVRRKALELLTDLEYIASGGNISVTITGSVGISTYDGDGKTFETLYREADEALYRAKNGGKNKYCYFKDNETEEHTAYDTENRRTALTESGAFIQLQALIDNIEGGIALLEIADETRAIFLSHSYLRLMNVSHAGVDEADGKVFNFIYKDDIRGVNETLHQGAVSGKPVEAVFRRLTENEETKWYHMRAVRIPYEDSDKPVLLAIVTDVTNLKMTELNNQAQKRQLETVLRISRVVTFEVDIPKRTLNVADPTVAKYGIDVHSIENMPESLIEAGAIHPDSIDECRRMYDEIYSGIPEGSAIIRTLKRNGEYTIERFTYFTVFDDSGRPIKAVGVDEGLDTRSATRFRVDLIERQFKNYNDNMLTIVKVIVADDSYVFLKPEDIADDIRAGLITYTDLLDYRIKQLIDPADKLVVKEMFSVDGLKKDITNIFMLSQEYRVREPDGTVKWNSMSASLYVDQFDGKKYAFVRTRDISFRKNLEQKLNEKIVGDPYTHIYTFDTFVKLSDCFISSEDRKTGCAVMLFAIRNYDYLREQYGQIMADDMLVGFVGKVMTVINVDYLNYFDGKRMMAFFIPFAESWEALRQLAEKMIRFIKNPAYFQFHEEVFLDISCGIALSDDAADGFAPLYEQASSVLQSLDAQPDRNIAFFMPDKKF